MTPSTLQALRQRAEEALRGVPVGWTRHRDWSLRVCDGAHVSEAGCTTLAEAESLHRTRDEALAVAAFIAAAPQLIRELVAAVASIEEECRVLINQNATAAVLENERANRAEARAMQAEARVKELEAELQPETPSIADA